MNPKAKKYKPRIRSRGSRGHTQIAGCVDLNEEGKKGTTVDIRRRFVVKCVDFFQRRGRIKNWRLKNIGSGEREILQFV